MKFVAFAEVEPFPCHVLSARCDATAPKYLPPDTADVFDETKGKVVKGKKWKRADYSRIAEGAVPNFGDISQITDEDLEALGQVDVLEGGSPCQAFSAAGLRGGLNDERGNLMLVFCKLAQRMRRINGTRYVIWENVPGVLSDSTNGFGCFLGALAGENGPLVSPGKKWTGAGNVLGSQGSISWRVLDAQFWGVPQRRRRVFAVADFGDRSGASGAVLFESSGERRNSAEVEKAGEEAARLRVGGPDSGLVYALGMDSKDCIGADLAFALKASNGHNPKRSSIHR